MTRAQLSVLLQDRAALTHAGLVVAAVLVAAGIALGPVRGLFRKTDEAIVVQEKNMARNLRVLSPISKDVVVRDYRQYGDALRKKGSTAEESSAMVAEVEMLAAQSKIALSATKPRDPHPERDYEQYAVDLEFEASMTQTVTFLYAVENSPQMLRVDKLVLDSKAARAPGTLKASVIVSRVVTL